MRFLSKEYLLLFGSLLFLAAALDTEVKKYRPISYLLFMFGILFSFILTDGRSI